MKRSTQSFRTFVHLASWRLGGLTLSALAVER